MPIYEYICQKCGEEIEAIQKISDKPLKKHEDCGGKLEKKLSLSSFSLKGDGWYADGYAKNTKKNSTKKEKKPPKKEKSPAKT